MIVLQTHLNTRIVDFLEGVSRHNCRTNRYEIREELSEDDISATERRVTCWHRDIECSAITAVSRVRDMPTND